MAHIVLRRGIPVVSALFLILCTGCSASQPHAAELSAALAEQPTAAPTAKPTPAPTPEPTPEPVLVTDEMLASGMYDAYFDDAVFIGDSITLGFQNYCTGQRRAAEGFMGNARFLAAVSMSARLARQDTHNAGGVSFMYRGRAVSVTAGINEMEAKRVFILFGVNDFACRYPEETLGYYAELLDKLAEQCPNVEVVIHGVLPVTRDFCKKRKVAIEDWNAFNPLLEQFCQERGVLYFSFAERLMDENGYLSSTLSGDNMFHLNADANAVWVHALRLFAMSRLEPGAQYAPAEAEPAS